MENASKALIIAGAILLAILIISLGLLVYNQAKETVGSVNLDQQEIEVFNSKFTSFEGTGKSGSQVNSLISTVIASNQQAINDNTGTYICIGFPSISSLDKGGEKYDNTMVFMAVNKENKVSYNIMGYTPNDIDYKVLLMNECSSGDFDVVNSKLLGTWNESCDASLKVAEGKKYSVTYGYSNGLIDRIVVIEQ